MSNTLLKEWEDYRNQCYSGKLPDRQEIETKQAFFAGCMAALLAATKAANKGTEDDGMKGMLALLDEAEGYLLERARQIGNRN